MFIRLMLSILVLLALPAVAVAQSNPLAAATSSAEKSKPADLYGRGTPRTAVTELLGALAARDYDRAGYYMDLGQGADAKPPAKAADLGKRLQIELDNSGSLMPFAALSNDPNGQTDDGLALDLEKVGTLNKDNPILLKQTQGPEGPIWRISPETVAVLKKLDVPPEQEASLTKPVGTQFAGAPIKDWLVLLAGAFSSFLALWLISKAILFVMRAVMGNEKESAVYRFSRAGLPPLALFLAVVLFNLWANDIGVSIIARQTLMRYFGIIAMISLVWFGLRLVDAITGVTSAKMARSERRQAVSVISLMRRGAKIVLLALATIAILDTLGFDVTTGIAALGIGGIALALGAQKTVENLVGSVTMIADRPIQVGDFCRVGDILGTVEDIGIRSTRIRTLTRTIVTIPNGDLSALQIENYAARDRFLFNPVIGVEYGISAAKLREGVDIVERILNEHEKIDAEGARARFVAFGDSSLNIEVFSYITVGDYAESLVIQQELLLDIYRRLTMAGLGIAFPTRTIHMIQEKPADVEGDPKPPSPPREIK
ncbi:mechanosensitive ion channel family protein [Altericroceibacterium indicum]|nr:mechanosensitive ion channel family protein [Altericroceibacterium indicum]